MVGEGINSRISCIIITLGIVKSLHVQNRENVHLSLIPEVRNSKCRAFRESVHLGRVFDRRVLQGKSCLLDFISSVIDTYFRTRLRNPFL